MPCVFVLQATRAHNNMCLGHFWSQVPIERVPGILATLLDAQAGGKMGMTHAAVVDKIVAMLASLNNATMKTAVAQLFFAIAHGELKVSCACVSNALDT